MKEGLTISMHRSPAGADAGLRKAIAEVVEKTYQRATDFETEVTMTVGATGSNLCYRLLH